MKDEGYSLTTLAKSILHPVEPTEVPRFFRQALMEPPLYHDLAEQFGDKRLPEANILGNVLYHNYQIIATAKQVAAEAFLSSARFAGALGEDGVLRPGGVAAAAPAPTVQQGPVGSSPSPATAASVAPTGMATGGGSLGSGLPTDVKIDLRLWGADQGKAIRLRAPEVITPASFDRLIQTLRLQLRIEEPAPEPEPELDEPPSADEPDEIDAVEQE